MKTATIPVERCTPWEACNSGLQFGHRTDRVSTRANEHLARDALRLESDWRDPHLHNAIRFIGDAMARVFLVAVHGFVGLRVLY